MKKTLEDQRFRELLRTAGLKATPARLALLSVLENAAEPLSIEKIIARFGKKKVDTATIYRTLNALAAAGAVKQVDLRHGHAHYEFASPTDHHHLVCVQCGKIEDFIGCNFEEITRSVLKKSKQFNSVLEHSMEFFGRCKTCTR